MPEIDVYYTSMCITHFLITRGCNKGHVYYTKSLLHAGVIITGRESSDVCRVV